MAASHHRPEITRKQAAAERTSPPLDAIHDASTPVKTTILARRGVEKVRILSESRLHSLLGSAGDAAHQAEERSSEASAEAHAKPDVEAKALRDICESTIGDIEKRIERLSIVFHSIADALERLESACPASHTRPPATGGLPAIKKHLLKEMFF